MNIRTYELQMAQDPTRARMCGFGEKVTLAQSLQLWPLQGIYRRAARLVTIISTRGIRHKGICMSWLINFCAYSLSVLVVASFLLLHVW
jgi:hypothetical protein